MKATALERAATTARAGRHVILVVRTPDMPVVLDRLRHEPGVVRTCSATGRQHAAFANGGRIDIHSPHGTRLRGTAPDLVLIDDGTYSARLAEAVAPITGEVVWL